MCILLEFIYLNIITMHGPTNVKKKIIKLVLCQKKKEKRIYKKSQARQYMGRSDVMELRHSACQHQQKSSQCDIK
jgi:hypothetical protein